MDRAGIVTGSLFLFRIMTYLCYCKQGKRRLVVKPVHLNFNYWKRTEKAGSVTGLFYLCVVWFLNEVHPFISRPVIISFRER